MPVATAHNLVKSYAGETVFRGVGFEIQDRDRVALVGANGTGKTTLLRIIAGIEKPDAGGVAFASGTRLGYLPQEVTFPPGVTLRQHVLRSFQPLLDLEKRLEALQERISSAPAGTDLTAALRDHDRLQHEYEVGGGYTYQSRLREVLNGLGIEEERLDQPLETFSGGQRTRVALAELLLSGRDLLLLDEPTNHLDLEATEWLEEFLTSAPQAILITSHDRWFLDKVAKRVWELSHGKLERFTGNYSEYAAQRAERLERQRKEYEAQQRQIEKTEAFIDRYRAGQRARQARGRQKLLDRLERVERPRDAGAMALAIKSTLRSGETVLATEGLAVATGTGRPEPVRAQPGMPVVREATGARADAGSVLFRAEDLELRRGDRAAVVGPNGAGKTTFLRVVTGELAPAAGRVYVGYGVQLAYYAQAHEQLSTQKTVLDEILSAKNMGEAEARTYLGRFLFSGDDAFKSVGSLSGGERSRLALAKLALGNANFLVLDEPTNHLDIYSREALEEVLREFNGTILFVSHDRFLIDALATEVWSLESGRLTARKQSWAEFEEERRTAKERARAAAEQRRTAAAAPAVEAANETRTRTREAAKRKARLDALEAKIATATAELHVITAELEAASLAGDRVRIADLGRQHEAHTAALHELEYEWVRLQDEDEASLDAGTAAGYRSP
ncbi:MAG TPA: ABC-F family ATP-binding cassette domain-containing protein [Chloroflexota bacterium]|nr:ABC-F family ATP-binding cassette domain-containing protein [Chloroflexota bacterium]